MTCALPQLTGDAMNSLARAIAREKAAGHELIEEAAAAREITWVQDIFAHFGPGCPRTAAIFPGSAPARPRS
jgi:hypothetical protein